MLKAIVDNYTMSNKKCVALVELGNSHDECLFSQYYFLKEADYKIHLIINEIPFRRIKGIIDGESFFVIPQKKNWLSSWINLMRVNNYLIRRDIKTIIINTAQGNQVRNLTLLLSKKINITGIMHNADKLNKSFTQKIISRKVKKYLVLNDFVLREIQKSDIRMNLQSFYPIFYPQTIKKNGITKKGTDFRVCIPGNVEFKRRDYKGLIDELSINKINDNIKFIILGNASKNDGKLLISEIISRKLEKHFIFFKSFVPNYQFFKTIQTSDLIMPLVHPDKPNFKYYNRFKISGTYNLAFGFKIPMFVPRLFSLLDDFKEYALFYDSDEMCAKLNSFADKPQLIIEKKNKLEQSQKFSFGFQKKRYVDFVEK